MSLMLAPIEGTPYVGGNAPGFQSVSAAGLQVLVKSNLSATSDPTSSDDSGAGYRIGSRWINTITGKVWEAVSVATLAGAWKDLTATTPPAGSGSEFQYRASATSFGAVTGSSFSAGVATLPTLAVSDLTAGRIPYVGTAGRLVDSGNLTYDGTYIVLTPTYGSANRGIKSGEGINLSFRGGGYGDIGFGTDAAPWKHFVVGSNGGTTIGCRLASDGRLGWGGTQSDARGDVEVGWGRYSSTSIEANNGYNSASGGALRDVRMRSLYAIPQVITDVPINVNLASGQTADAIQVTSYGGTAGDKFKVSASGFAYANGFATQSSYLAITDLSTPGWAYNGISLRASGLDIRAGSASLIGWTASSDSYNQTLSAAFGFNAAGVIEVNNGTAGQYRDILVRSIGLGVAPSGTMGGINGNVTINVASGNPLTVQRNGVTALVVTDTNSNTGGVTIGNASYYLRIYQSGGQTVVGNNLSADMLAFDTQITSYKDFAVQNPAASYATIFSVPAAGGSMRVGYNATNYFSTTVASNGDTTFAITTGTTTNGFSFSNPVSCPGSNLGDERFGKGAGNGSGYCTHLGYGTYSTGGVGVLAAGAESFVWPHYGVAIGFRANVPSYSHTNSIALGAQSVTTAANQLMIGSTGCPINAMKLITDGVGGSLNFGVTSGNLTITPSGGAVGLADAVNFTVGTTAGTKFGTATTQKISFWNATPIMQPSAAEQVALINNTAGTYDGTLEALPDPTDSPASADALRDDLVSVLLPAVRNNFTDLFTQVAAVRTALVNAGLMKGSA